MSLPTWSPSVYDGATGVNALHAYRLAYQEADTQVCYHTLSREAFRSAWQNLYQHLLRAGLIEERLQDAHHMSSAGSVTTELLPREDDEGSDDVKAEDKEETVKEEDVPVDRAGLEVGLSATNTPSPHDDGDDGQKVNASDDDVVHGGGDCGGGDDGDQTDTPGVVTAPMPPWAVSGNAWTRTGIARGAALLGAFNPLSAFVPPVTKISMPFPPLPMTSAGRLRQQRQIESAAKRQKRDL